MSVVLALHRMVTKVGHQPEPIGAVLRSKPHSHSRHLRHSVVGPQFCLGQVTLRHRQKHHRHPSENIADGDHILILVKNFSRLLPSDDLTKDTVPSSQNRPSIYLERSAVPCRVAAHRAGRVSRCLGNLGR
mgnify:CR=1 FL=1